MSHSCQSQNVRSSRGHHRFKDQASTEFKKQSHFRLQNIRESLFHTHTHTHTTNTMKWLIMQTELIVYPVLQTVMLKTVMVIIPSYTSGNLLAHTRYINVSICYVLLIMPRVTFPPQLSSVTEDTDLLLRFAWAATLLSLPLPPLCPQE